MIRCTPTLHSYHLQSLRLPPHVPWSNLLLNLGRISAVSECSGFLFLFYFEMQPQQFVNERSKIAFIISLLSGRALQWARSIWDSQSQITHSPDAFVNHFKEVFGTTALTISVHVKLLQLRQAGMSIHDYTVGFRTLAATSGWDEIALLSAFRRGWILNFINKWPFMREKWDWRISRKNPCTSLRDGDTILSTSTVLWMRC